MKTRFFPSTLTETITVPELGIECKYNNESKPVAIFYAGTKSKRDWYYRFSNKEDMMVRINSDIKKYRKIAEEKLQNKLATKALKAEDHFKLGDIIVNTWGYEQTNVNFYQVVRLTAKKIFIKEICKNYTETGFMSGNSTPIPNKFKTNGDECQLGMRKYGDKVFLTHPKKYFYFRVWDGQPEYESHYA